jgi:hypothetical protein
MTETVQFRIQLPMALRDRLKTLCLRSNVTMTDKVVKLIEQEVDHRPHLPVVATPKITALNDDRLIARVVDASDKLGTAAERLNASLQTKLEGLSQQILSAIPKPPSPAHIEAEHVASAKKDQLRLNQILAKVEALNADIVKAVYQGQEAMAAQIQSKRTRWQALGTGLLAGMMLSAIFLLLISSTPLSHRLAISLVGAKSDWQAAQIITGKDSPLHSVYLTDTHALLKSPAFELSYLRCLKRARASKTSFDCTVRYMPLRPIE